MSPVPRRAPLRDRPSWLAFAGASTGDAALAREVRRLAFPAIAHSLLQTLVFVVDRVMLGRHGGASLAAIQLAGSIEWSIWSVFAAFEVGTIARVGRHVGAGDREGARRAALTSLALALSVGSVVALVAPLLVSGLPVVGGQMSAEALAEARAYLSVTLLASPLVFVGMTAVATLQAGGDTRTPLAIGIGVNVLHVAMNRALILGVTAFGVTVAPMGARGAAISTAITFGLQAALALLALGRASGAVSLARAEAGPRDGRASRDEARALARVAAPAFLERAVYHAGYVAFVLIVARLGDTAMAANQSLISVEAICFLSADGFGIAAAALVAQKLGAGDPARARRAASLATRYAVVLLTAFGAIALLGRGVLLPVFSRDPEIVALGTRVMPVLLVAQPFMAMGVVLSQALRGAGRTKEALLVSTLGAVVVRLAATWLLAVTLGLGLVGVWIGSTLDWLVRSALLTRLGIRAAAAPQR